MLSLQRCTRLFFSCIVSGCSASWLARLVRDQEVEDSKSFRPDRMCYALRHGCSPAWAFVRRLRISPGMNLTGNRHIYQGPLNYATFELSICKPAQT